MLTCGHLSPLVQASSMPPAIARIHPWEELPGEETHAGLVGEGSSRILGFSSVVLGGGSGLYVGASP